jgi:glycosyltransferase involved in cell wall biosynthesis
MSKKISVIITTYNVDPYIEKCINSILAQTHQNIQIILVDDASTDATLALAEAALANHTDKTVVTFPKNTLGGVGTPANVGLDLCTGDYIAFADGDDWYEPDMLEALLDVAERDDADTVMANYKNFDQVNNEIKDPADAKRWDLLEKQFNDGESQDTLQRHILKFTPVPWRKLYRAEFIRANDLRFPEGDFFFEDNPLHWFTTIKAARLSVLNKVICYHRVNRPGQTMGSNGKELLFFYRHYESTLQWLRDEGQFEAYELELISWIVAQIEWTSKKIVSELWMDLYEEVSAVFDNHSEKAIFAALGRNNVGAYGWSLITAAKFKKPDQFVQVLLSGPANHQMMWDRTRQMADKINTLEAETSKLRATVNNQMLSLQRLTRASILYASEKN